MGADVCVFVWKTACLNVHYDVRPRSRGLCKCVYVFTTWTVQLSILCINIPKCVWELQNSSSSQHSFKYLTRQGCSQVSCYLRPIRDAEPHQDELHNQWERKPDTLPSCSHFSHLKLWKNSEISHCINIFI